MLFFGFPISSYLIQPYAASTGCTESYVKTTLSNLLLCYIQIIKPYMGQIYIHQIPETLRPASLSKLDNMVNSDSIFNTKYAEFSTKWYAYLYIQPPTQSPPKNHSSTSGNFYLPISPLTCSQNHPYNSHQHSLPLKLSNF